MASHTPWKGRDVPSKRSDPIDSGRQQRVPGKIVCFVPTMLREAGLVPALL